MRIPTHKEAMAELLRRRAAATCKHPGVRRRTTPKLRAVLHEDVCVDCEKVLWYQHVVEGGYGSP